MPRPSRPAPPVTRTRVRRRSWLSLLQAGRKRVSNMLGAMLVPPSAAARGPAPPNYPAGSSHRARTSASGPPTTARSPPGSTPAARPWSPPSRPGWRRRRQSSRTSRPGTSRSASGICAMTAIAVFFLTSFSISTVADSTSMPTRLRRVKHCAAPTTPGQVPVIAGTPHRADRSASVATVVADGAGRRRHNNPLAIGPDQIPDVLGSPSRKVLPAERLVGKQPLVVLLVDLAELPLAAMVARGGVLQRKRPTRTSRRIRDAVPSAPVSHRPAHCPHQMPAVVETALLELRRSTRAPALRCSPASREPWCIGGPRIALTIQNSSVLLRAATEEALAPPL